MHGWSRFISTLDFCAVYFTTQLMRCAVFSFVLIVLVMLLRKMVFRKRTFARGRLWTAFLIVPFLGKLRLFYENTAIGRMMGWITKGTMTCLWADRIYMIGILIAVICIFGKRFRLRKTVAGMEMVIFENVRIRVADMNVTPFTVGLLKPKIVLPKAMLDSYSKDEIKAIVQHEQTHIRLGHLWCGVAWDILRCLLWVNPFLLMIQKYFRADMEDVCDRVCIQNSGKTAQEYGRVLLKSVKLLRVGQKHISSGVTYAEENDFADIKRRMLQITGFRPYRKRLCICMAVTAFMIIGSALLVIRIYSYAGYNESKDILVYQYDGEAAVISNDTDTLSRMISYDDCYVYVEREEFEQFLFRNNARGEIYIVFGGYYKLPGLGGAAESCFYESGSTDGRIVQIPYKSIRDNWDYVLFKLL